MSDTKKRKLKTEKTVVKRIKSEKENVEQNLNNASTSQSQESWQPYELLAEQQNLDFDIARNITKLLSDGNTIPFIARYRRNITNNMTPERLREVKENYDEICNLKSKIETVVKQLEKSKVLNGPLRKSVISSRSIEELEYIYAPFKPGNKRTLAERAKELGLETPAMDLLNNTKTVNLSKYIDASNKDLANISNVEKGIINIIAAFISTDTDMLTMLRNLRKDANCIIKTKKAVISTKTESSSSNKSDDNSKYDNYYNFEMRIKFIKPHQILAINRGENQKALSVKIILPDYVFKEYEKFCYGKWINKTKPNDYRKNILSQAVQDSYTRLVQPLIIREIRSELKQNAEKASYQVFSNNLKQLLLIPPLKGQPILGIDPGFSNGCKLALISNTGTLLSSDVIYPHTKSKSNHQRDINILKNMLSEHNCNLIALGNGTACRETEEWLAKLIENKVFKPLDIRYTIVNEDGASIYSCSDEAKKEFPKLDPNLISAVSLARRIQDPLAELVKVEPRHLGIGMYQHDLKKKQLEEVLDEVVLECVSFVGIDLNTASQCLLKHVAGISDKRALLIVQYRDKHGPFLCRQQLMDIKGIGAKSFQQCAGFLRVGPLNKNDTTNFYKQPKTTKLDCTYIHPESYQMAIKIMKKFNLNVNDIGEFSFINTFKTRLSRLNPVELSNEYQSDVETIKLILDTFCKPLNHDLRSECDSHTPLFRKSLTNINHLVTGTVLTGRVSNVTHFGSFVDIGVGCNGLIHTSKYNGFTLQLGDRVEVKIIDIDIAKKRIGLSLLKKL